MGVPETAGATRRDVLRLAGLVTAALGVGGWALPGPTTSDLTRGLFAPLVGSAFTLRAPGAAHRATLLPLRDIDTRRQRGTAQSADRSFALRFQGGAAIGGGLYRLTRPGFAPVVLHLEARPGRPGLLEAVIYSAPQRKAP